MNKGPYCECGRCDATGRKGGAEVKLPAAAWRVAGYGDLNAVAVAPGHEEFFPGARRVKHRGWVEVFAE